MATTRVFPAGGARIPNWPRACSMPTPSGWICVVARCVFTSGIRPPVARTSLPTTACWRKLSAKKSRAVNMASTAIVKSMENILVIRLKAIGDVIFTLPAIGALRENFPAAKITFLTSKENAPLLRGFREVNEVITLDRVAFRSGNPLTVITEFFSLLRPLRAGKFSLVVDFQGFGETAWLARLTGAPQRWGSVYGSGRRWAYTRGLIRDEKMHPAEWNLQLLANCGVKSQIVKNEFSLLDDALTDRTRVA